MDRGLLPWIGAAALLCAALLYIRALRVRVREQSRALADAGRRDRLRADYCAALGHHLDAACLCTRCLVAQHAYEVVDTKERTLRQELVNPNADPGALYLDSNFQPDYDYGLTQTVYERLMSHRCARCSREMETREEYAVEDPR